MAYLPEYTNVMNSFQAQADRQRKQVLEDAASQLSRRGIFSSGYGNRPLNDISNQFNEMIASKNAGMGLQQAQAGQQERQFDVQSGLQKQQLELQRRQLEAQLQLQQQQREAASRASKDWWKPALGTIAGAFLGGPGGAIVGNKLFGGGSGSNDYEQLLNQYKYMNAPVANNFFNQMPTFGYEPSQASYNPFAGLGRR